MGFWDFVDKHTDFCGFVVAFTLVSIVMLYVVNRVAACEMAHLARLRDQHEGDDRDLQYEGDDSDLEDWKE